MNHQPFEEWLLNDKNLTPAESRELDLHLRTCVHCTSLSATGLALRSANALPTTARRSKDRRPPPQIMGHDGINSEWDKPALLVRCTLSNCIHSRAGGMGYNSNRLFSIYCYCITCLNRSGDCSGTHGTGFYSALCLDGAFIHFSRARPFVDNFNLAV